ncbi:MAG: hypothetical protein IPJ34_43550 [Myxococcales bacterium]|nr:hypothetical protein [Myxococcales bacterium]
MPAPKPSEIPQGTRPPLPGARVHFGIDENGLGPVLGPLVVTGVALAGAVRPRTLGPLVGDSKALVAHGDVALGEAWARVLLEALGKPPARPADVLAHVSLDDPEILRGPCPKGRPTKDPHSAPSAMCYPPDESEAFVASDVLLAEVRAALAAFPARPVALRAAFVCANRYNAAVDAGRNKLVLDLHEMERIALAMRTDADLEGNALFDAVCGKVGGIGKYSGYFGPLGGHLHAIEQEAHGASVYRFPGLGRFAFVVDADAQDPLVGLASLVGKYLRELGMGRIVKWLRAQSGEDLAEASGYRDPVTKQFIEATALVRRRRGVPDRCFVRNT